MTPIMYIGLSDVRVLTSADLASLGVERKSDLVFLRGERVEVSEELADILLDRNNVLSREFRPWDDEVTIERGERVEADEESRELQRQTLLAGRDEDPGAEPTEISQPPRHVENPPDPDESGEGKSGDSEKAAKASKSKARKSS